MAHVPLQRGVFVFSFEGKHNRWMWRCRECAADVLNNAQKNNEITCNFVSCVLVLYKCCTKWSCNNKFLAKENVMPNASLHSSYCTCFGSYRAERAAFHSGTLQQVNHTHADIRLETEWLSCKVTGSQWNSRSTRPGGSCLNVSLYLCKSGTHEAWPLCFRPKY